MTNDSMSQIQKCLNCTLEYCDNCIERGEEVKDLPLFDWNRTKITKVQQEYIDWYYMGYKDKEIAEKIGVSVNAVYSRRCALGLPPLPLEAPRDVCKSIARRVLGWKRRK